MDRRGFLKMCAALGVTVSIPSFVFIAPMMRVVELVSYDVDERRLSDAVRVGRIIMRDGQGYVECSLDKRKLWTSVTLKDSEGRTWTTEDGERWSCGNEWFMVDIGG